MAAGKIKGTIMIEVVKFLKHHKREARELVPSHLHSYFDARILSTSWHSEEDYLELMRAVVALRGPDPEGKVSDWEASARATTKAYFEGPYKALVRAGDAVRTLANLQSLWRLRHDTGQMMVASDGPNAARIRLSDYALVAAESCQMIQGTIWGYLHHAEAKSIEIEHTHCRARGEAMCEWKATWS
jgi:hypothetical protein